MKIIKAQAQLLEQRTRLGLVEACGRICYKSEDRIGPGTAAKFVSGLIKAQHDAMIEHATYTIHVPIDDIRTEDLTHGSFLVYDVSDTSDSVIVSGNVRAWRNYFKYCITWGLGCEFLLDALCTEDVEAYSVFFGDLFPDYIPLDDVDEDLRNTFVMDEDQVKAHFYNDSEARKRHIFRTIMMRTDRGVTHELVRHRPASFAQESTRYCNYSGHMEFILPSFWDVQAEGIDCDERAKRQACFETWYAAVSDANESYKTLIARGAKPQEARSVLPNSLKTDIVVTASMEEWDHIIELRTAPSAHPQIQDVINMSKELLYGQA